MAKKLKRRRAKEVDEVVVADDVRESVMAIFLLRWGQFCSFRFLAWRARLAKPSTRFWEVPWGWRVLRCRLFCSGLAPSVVIGDRRLLTIRNIVALGMFVLAFDGLLNMVFARGVTDGAIVAKYGGMLGLVISSSLANAMGTTGALIISAACLLVSVILLLNTSLRTLLSPLLSVLGLLRKREADEDGEEVEEDVPFDEREDVEKAEAVAAVELEVAEEDEDSAPYVAPAEQVMTTASRRKIEVPPDLLDDRSSDAKPGDIERGKEIIERTFAQFGIPVEMSDVKVGPTVTQYALHPAQGVKLARIVALQNDLALCACGTSNPH